MELEKLLKLKRKIIPLYPREPLTNIFPGEKRSSWKGDGIEFVAIKSFEPGDNPREIDRHSLARGKKEIIQRMEGRELKIDVWLDISGSLQTADSMIFASKPKIRDIACAIVLWSALDHHCPVGFLAFDQEIKTVFPARLGEIQCLAILEWIRKEGDKFPPQSSNFQQIFFKLARLSFGERMVFLISDFQDPIFEKDFTSLFKPFLHRLDFIPIIIKDPLETKISLKKSTRITVKDSEKEKCQEIYITPQKLKNLQRISQAHCQHLQSNFKKINITPIVLSSPNEEECFQKLCAFFQARMRSRR